jgi:hypothetical protein
MALIERYTMNLLIKLLLGEVYRLKRPGERAQIGYLHNSLNKKKTPLPFGEFLLSERTVCPKCLLAAHPDLASFPVTYRLSRSISFLLY